jgi:hypothetical protein
LPCHDGPGGDRKEIEAKEGDAGHNADSVAANAIIDTTLGEGNVTESQALPPMVQRPTLIMS